MKTIQLSLFFTYFNKEKYSIFVLHKLSYTVKDKHSSIKQRPDHKTWLKHRKKFIINGTQKLYICTYRKHFQETNIISDNHGKIFSIVMLNVIVTLLNAEGPAFCRSQRWELDAESVWKTCRLLFWGMKGFFILLFFLSQLYSVLLLLFCSYPDVSLLLCSLWLSSTSLSESSFYIFPCALLISSLFFLL